MLNIPLRVRNLVRRHGTSDPYRIAKELGCTVMLCDLPEHANGMWCRILRRKYIFISDGLEEWQQAAVLCHELGHIICHPHYQSFSIRCVSYSRTSHEQEANDFAEVLMSYRYSCETVYVKKFLEEG